MFPPLPDHVVNLTLQYLLPPSGPLPLHLISKQSLQRHHFLDIDPTDSESYFCWPTSSLNQSPALVIRALELLAGNEELLERQGHDVKYDADEDTKRARVHIGNDVQLIFLWQDAEEIGNVGESGWRYHDAKFTPTDPPSGANFTVETRANDQPLDASGASHEIHPRSSSPPSDSYWDAYGASSLQDSPDAKSFLQVMKGGVSGQSAEDAYWNSYASVHGTADSTIPSPYVEPRNLKQPHYTAQSTSHSPAIPDLGATRDTKEEGKDDGYFPSTERVLRAYVPPPSNIEGGDDATSHAEQLARALVPVLRGKVNRNPATDGNPTALANKSPKLVNGLRSRSSLHGTDEDDAPTLANSPSDVVFSSSRSGSDPATEDDVDEGLFKLWVARRQPSLSSTGDLRKEFLALVENGLL
ncbi:hypothetical protein BS47DRAFT_1343080 [Hydnum rufescens UP504]|uniref:Uncharacterized protein n=1 Tax=Hydnum rufescens UP504 TaxID=1448309 RepID=A0A9P6AZD1_9AGAM|nr:hypothetical protein BS47DRAFT_1343080 [Hydnum rufescens UP504]